MTRSHGTFRLFLTIAFFLVSGSTCSSMGPLSVPVVKVSKRTITRRLAASGEVVATTRVRLGLTAQGPIRFCPWREGDVVEKEGTRLLEIDRPLYRAEVGVAQASLAVAQAKLAELEAGERPEVIAKATAAVERLTESASFTKRDLARIEKLVGNRSLAAEDLEKARVEAVGSDARLAEAKSHHALLRAGPTKEAIQVQQALVGEAEARLERAKARLAESVLPSPFAGVVTAVHVRPGDLAAPNQTLLEMVDPCSFVIRFVVPEAFSWSIKEGSDVKATLDAHPGETFEGRVVRLYPEVDSRMRTRTCEAVVVGTAALAPGMFARLELVVDKRLDVPSIPLGAVRRGADGTTSVFVAAEGKATRRTVILGMEEASDVAVEKGLSPGEVVIVGGWAKLRDGMAVRTFEKEGQGERRGPR